MPPKLTMAQADKVGRDHAEWQAMTLAERREYVRQVNAALVSEAKAEAAAAKAAAYFESFLPKVTGRKAKKR